MVLFIWQELLVILLQKLIQYYQQKINYLSTKLVVDSALYFNIKQFVFASTCSVYGASNNDILNEKIKG